MSCNNGDCHLKYLAENTDSMDILVIPVIEKGIKYGFFIGFNNQIYQTIYLKKYPNREIDYKCFLVKLLEGDIYLNDFLTDYNIEIVDYDSAIINDFAFNAYLIKRDEYYYFKENLPLKKQYNIIKILFDNSYQVIFNDYSGEYYFKKYK